MRRLPASTYRLQLTPGFGFRDAAELVPYLAELGVTDVYLSPPFESAPGSTHGYDVVDHNQLRAALGGEAGYEELCRALEQASMGQLVDFVPNHMGIGPENPWWTDVLENGPSSVYAPYFDVDWKPVKDELENKVLMPVLGDQFGEVLERGELKLQRDGGSFCVCYWEHRFPVAPRHVPRILAHRIEALVAELGESDIQLQELLSIVTALEKLAPRHEVDPDKVAERAREKEVAKRRLAALFEASPRLREHVDENVRLFNGTVGDPRSFDLLADLLDAEAYRLAHWRVAGEEINYRRFFDINSLAAIRMEDERVFDDTHRLVLRLIAEGKITGLRIDHPDGLYQPSLYFQRLKSRVDGLYLIAEKILEAHEKMPASWRVDGTTGYEFLNCVGGLFVDGRNQHGFDELYARFTGERVDFSTLVYEKKKALMRGPMASELNVLSHRLNRISEGDRRTRDFTLNSLGKALIEYVARLPIYRTYVEGDTPDSVEERDRQYILRTIAAAKRAGRELNRTIYDFLADVLLLKRPTDESREFVRKLQQVTPPVTAKSIEDTAFYLFNRLVCLNEVGGDPKKFGAGPDELHAMCRERLERWPGSLNTTTTHDTKRSEDVRLRIAALSEIPAEWEQRLSRWAQLNAEARATVDDQAAPDPNEELLVYQTLLGSFPDDGVVSPEYLQRLGGYVEKALREAKVHSSWIDPDEAYEQAVKAFVEKVLASRPFLEDFLPFARRIAHAARLSSLAQVALKLAAPGVPDVYQGTELWDLSLVDPDNRRPVDWELRRRLLHGLVRRLAEGPAARAQLAEEVSQPGALVDGRAKLLLLREGLRLRRAQPALFLEGRYVPLALFGPHAAHAVAFARVHDGGRVVCVVPRLVLQLLDASPGAQPRWDGAVVLPEELRGRYADVVTGDERDASAGELSLASLFGRFPVALLVNAA